MIDRLPSAAPPSLVLVVDDEPKNVQVVGSLLLRHGHEIIAAASGPEALEKLETAKPDLILLDFMMPGMTGFELCRILKADPRTSEIPVIFLSAVTDKTLIVEGLGHGGVDYITKPFHGRELVSRVELHMNLQNARRRLARLIDEKNRVLEIVAHDLKNPLNGIQFAAAMLAERDDGSDEGATLLFESIRDSAARAFEIVSNLLETRGLNELKSTLRSLPVDLAVTTRAALRNLDQHLRKKEIQVTVENASSPDAAVMVLGEERAILCCIENLLSNAIKFSPPGAPVRIRISSDGEMIVEDAGPGVQEDEIDQLFVKFTRLSARPTGGEASTGLGLHIVRELVTAMNGIVEYRPSPLGGAAFHLRLPKA